jgi:hypothetical protein
VHDQVAVDKAHPASREPSFEGRIVAVLLDETGFTSATLTAQPAPSNGRFQTVWSCPDGTYVTYRHGWSKGIGYLMKAGSYFGQFKQPLPAWALRMPPFVCWRLCDLALSAGQPLPAQCPRARNCEGMFARFAAATEGAKRFRSA